MNGASDDDVGPCKLQVRRVRGCEEATELELELRAMRPLISIYLSPPPVKEAAKRQVRQKRRLVHLPISAKVYNAAEMSHFTIAVGLGSMLPSRLIAYMTSS